MMGSKDAEGTSRMGSWMRPEDARLECSEARLEAAFRRLDERLESSIDRMVRSQRRTLFLVQVITVIVIAVLAFGLR